MTNVRLNKQELKTKETCNNYETVL